MSAASSRSSRRAGQRAFRAGLLRETDDRVHKDDGADHSSVHLLPDEQLSDSGPEQDINQRTVELLQGTQDRTPRAPDGECVRADLRQADRCLRLSEADRAAAYDRV
jgi:hypothetical protein